MLHPISIQYWLPVSKTTQISTFSSVTAGTHTFSVQFVSFLGTKIEKVKFGSAIFTFAKTKPDQVLSKERLL